MTEVENITSNIIVTMLDLARSNIEKKDLLYSLSAAVIYSSIAEFISDTIVYTLNHKINSVSKSQLENNIGLNVRPNKKTNLGSSISKLNTYTFNRKEELITTLELIRDSRNNLFHNLMVAHLKGINIDSEIKNIQENTEKLIDIWHSSDHLQPNW